MTKSHRKKTSIILVICGITAVAIFAIVFKDVTLYNKTNPTIKKLAVQTLDAQKLKNSTAFLYPEKFVFPIKNQQI